MKKMPDWVKNLKYNPIPSLRNSTDKAISYFTRRDLLGEKVEPINLLWELPAPQKLLKKQRTDGLWKYPGKGTSPETNYDVFQTIKMLRELVVKYEFNKNHPLIEKAAEYLLSFQTEEGDIREMYGIQYSPNYTSIAFETLIEAGYEEDPRVERYFQWILSVRQDDGGWAIPMRTLKIRWQDAVQNTAPLQPKKSKPSSHWVTDLVLRAFAAHPKYRKVKAAEAAGNLLMSRFFSADKYTDRRKAEYWTTFTYPFWWGDLLSSLNSLSLVGFLKNEPSIEKALEYFIHRQQSNGLWKEKGLMGRNDEVWHSWHSLAICRVFKRFDEAID